MKGMEEYVSSEWLYHKNYDFNCPYNYYNRKTKYAPPTVLSFSADYNQLINKPSLDGEVIQGDMYLNTISPEMIDKMFEEKEE